MNFEEPIYYDVDNLKQLPKLENPKTRYLDFIGGSKEIRAFVVPYDLPRTDFIKENKELIETEIFEPIYENKGIVITPDMSYALPGFYVLSYKSFIHHCDSIPDNLIMRTGVLLKYLRKAMKDALGIECCNLYSDEKRRKSNVLHYWIVPKNPEYLQEGLDQKLININLSEYLSCFKYSINKDKMLDYNTKMRKYFDEINLKEIDNSIFDLAKRSIILSVTSQCNKKCFGCYNRFRGNDMPKEDWIKFIDYVAEQGVKKITISGGDPLNREDIFIIINHCLEKGIKLNMDTVGSVLLEEDYVLQKKYNNTFSWEVLSKLECIGIPLDGSSSIIANKFRNESNDFVENQLKIISKLIKNNCKVSVNTVLSKNNIHDVKNIFEILNNYNIKKWQIFQFMGIGQIAVHNADMFDVSVNEFENVKQEIFDFTKNSSFIVNVKSEEDRFSRYIIIDSLGDAFYIESRENSKIEIGSILSEDGRKDILEKYYFIQ